MCTIVLAWQAFDDAPVVVAANRDEAADRPSSPPQVIDTDPRTVAPLDNRAGGTWIGYNEHGLIAAVTNRWTDASLAGERSRGLLVRDALAQPSADAAAVLTETATDTVEYDGFSLLVADASHAELLVWDGTLRRQQLDPGVHVVGNVGTDQGGTIPEFDHLDPEQARQRASAARTQLDSARRARDRLSPQDGEPVTAWRDRAAAVLCDHDYGFCVHRDGFGTQSSSLLTLWSDGSADYQFADGPPCTVAYKQVSQL